MIDPNGLEVLTVGVGGSLGWGGYSGWSGGLTFGYDSERIWEFWNWNIGATTSVTPVGGIVQPGLTAFFGPQFSISPNSVRPEDFNGWSATIGASLEVSNGVIAGVEVSNIPLKREGFPRIAGDKQNYTFFFGNGVNKTAPLSRLSVYGGYTYTRGGSISLADLERIALLLLCS